MNHPYVGLPDRQFWKKEPGVRQPSAFDPVSPPPFTLKAEDKIVTAGSCFAQHVARRLNDSGLTHFVTEKAHPIIPPRIAERHNYGLFSARYGNVYTARQLLQLLQRAYGEFEPLATSWPAKDDDGVVDPFRPQIQPGNFLSLAELNADRAQHFRCIRQSIESMDVFVFTLGLTECWEDVRDGAIFPIAPGVAGGEYDPEIVRFRNFDEVATWDDLSAALGFIRARNPDVRIILTVSPVPLNATYEDRHVAVATTWSKAVLRLVADKATRHFSDCYYFPSYEIITSPHTRGQYFAEDCREVLPQGVDHVMRLFEQHFVPGAPRRKPAPKVEAERDTHVADMERKIDILCDEEAIDNAAR